MQCPFLLWLCQEVLLRGFWWFFFFRSPFVPEAESMQSVSACPMNVASGHTQQGKPGRKNVAARWNKYHRIGNIHTSLSMVCTFHASDDFLFLVGSSFLRIFPEVFVFQSASVFVYLHLAPFSRIASGSHFRSGRKGNSGIWRESKVKPPVFGKNLQPCG